LVGLEPKLRYAADPVHFDQGCCLLVVIREGASHSWARLAGPMTIASL
jgi:hypothetical protein